MKRLLLLFVPAIALAQTPRRDDLGVWLNNAHYGTTSEGTLEVSMRQRTGWGLSATHFFRDRLSLAVSFDELRGRGRLSDTDLGESLDAGPARIRAYTAALQHHFTPAYAPDVYAGIGAAYASGRIDVPAEATEQQVPGTINFKSAVVPMIEAGLTFDLGHNLAAGAEVKWMRYHPRLDTTPDDPFQTLRLQPLVIAVGVRVRR